MIAQGNWSAVYREALGIAAGEPSAHAWGMLEDYLPTLAGDRVTVEHSVPEFAEALAHWPASLRRLTFYDNVHVLPELEDVWRLESFPGEASGWLVLARTLLASPELFREALRLEHQFAAVVPSLTRLEAISWPGAVAMAGFLAQFPSVRELDLTRADVLTSYEKLKIAHREWAQFFAEPAVMTLSNFEISGLPFAQGLEALAHSPLGSRLQALTMRRCGIGEVLIPALARWPGRLEGLDVSDNPLGADTCEQLVHWAAANNLKELSLIRCDLNEDEVAHVARLAMNAGVSVRLKPVS